MKSRRIWRTGLIALGILAGAWAFAALLLPVLWPFLIGLAVSLLAEKPVRLLQTRARFPRWLASGVCVLTLFVLLFGGAFFLCRLLCTEAADLARQLPQLAEGLAPPVLRLKDRLLSLAEKLPDGLGKGLRAGVESFFQNGAGFGSKLYESLFSWASGVIGRLPDAVLFTVTAVLSSFMLSGELPAIRTWLQKLARPEWLEKLQRLGGHVRTTLGGWLRAQLILMLMTFFELLIGFLLGGVLACGVVVVKFLLDGMVYSASELNRSTGLPVLGALASDRTKKAGKLDAKLYQMEGRPDGSADAEMLCLMAQTIRSRAPEAKNILVTGDLPADQLEALAAALQATEPLRGQSVTAAESILKAAATVPHVVAADAIVLAADCTVTRTDAVREQNEKIVRLGKQILGCIVYE